jgi:peptidyl-prolyl cis-trans isomerase SurA
VIGARRLAALGALTALASAVAGCAIPTWVPLIGKDKPAAAKASAAAVPERSAPSTAPVLAAKRAQLPDSQDVLDRVICVVNNDAITLYELEEAEARYLHENKETPPAGDARKALRERLLAHLIETRIQLQQAERDKINVEEVEITEQVGEIMQKLNVKAQPEFEAMLKKEGLSLEAVKKRIRDQIMVQRLTRRKVALRVSVTEQEIDRYLADNRAKLETGLSFQARHMLFLPDAGKGEEGWDAARQKAEQVYASLLDGQDFSELAAKYSEDGSGKEGGDLGSLKRGELAPDIEEAILKLPPGQFSAPFRSQVGYHLFRLDSKESLTGEALVQARSQIREILYRQKYDARLQEWLTEIKQRAIIDIRM